MMSHNAMTLRLGYPNVTTRSSLYLSHAYSPSSGLYRDQKVNVLSKTGLVNQVFNHAQCQTHHSLLQPSSGGVNPSQKIVKREHHQGFHKWGYPQIILIGLCIINHPFWGSPIYGNLHVYV